MTDDLDLYRAGSTEPWTADVIAALVAARRPRVLIETGTFEGRTTRKIAAAMPPDALLYTVEADPDRAAAVGTIPGALVVVADALAFLRTFTGTADFIFLDDDHSAGHVNDEVEAALDILAPDGILCLHDVVGPFGLGAVVRHHGGIVLDFPRLHIAGGLGIITR